MNVPDELLPDGWTQDHLDRLVCPHGNVMEMDGSGPCGCTSPLREQGYV